MTIPGTAPLGRLKPSGTALGAPGTVLPFKGSQRGSGTTWNARRALLRPLYCLLVGDNISVLLSALGTPSGSWNRASGSPWNARQRTWNALWALGTVLPAGESERSWNAPQRTWNARKGSWNHQEQTLRLSCPPIGAKEQFR